MLAKEYRLSGKKNFEQVFKEGKLFQSDTFGINFLKRPDEAPSRFGFVVSTKVSKIAIHRNRVKRAMSEAVRFLTNKLGKGYNIVFLAKGKSMKVSTDQIMREVGQALKKAGLTNE